MRQALAPILLFLIGFFGFGAIPESASALDLHFPGSFFGELRYPNSPVLEERENYMFEGSLEQGIEWFRFAERWRLNTFGELRFNVDREGLDYNNRLIPGIGIKLRGNLGAGAIQFGLKAVEEHRYKSDRSDRIILGFINFWAGWDLRKK